jgi:CBS domain-containing protein
MHVAQILKEKGSRVVTTTADATIADAARTLRRERIGAILVTNDDGTPAGIISERDIVRGLADTGASLLEKHVADLMTRSLFTCAPSATVEAVMEEMTSGRCRHIPVLEDNVVVGMISIGDVVRSRVDTLESESDQLKNYIVNP